MDGSRIHCFLVHMPTAHLPCIHEACGVHALKHDVCIHLPGIASIHLTCDDPSCIHRSWIPHAFAIEQSLMHPAAVHLLCIHLTCMHACTLPVGRLACMYAHEQAPSQLVGSHECLYRRLPSQWADSYSMTVCSMLHAPSHRARM